MGVAGGRPRRSALRRCEGRLNSGAVPSPAARPLVGLSGSATDVPWAPVCGCGGPALSLWVSCPVGGCVPRGWWGAVPGEVAFHRCEGRLVSCAVPLLSTRPLGRAAGVPRPEFPLVRLVWAWGPSTGPPARAIASRCCTLWGWWEGVPGGGALRWCEECLNSGALPPPAEHLLGGLSRSATHVLWARVCGAGGPALSPWLACPVGGWVPRGWWGAVLGGLAFHRCEGRLVSGAVPPPVARPLGRAARVPRPVCPGRSQCGRGDPAPVPQRALLRAAVARLGLVGGRPGGGCLSPLCGAS